MMANLMLSIRGYMAPEYAIHGQLSEKADTYSFGVVALEIICGRKSSEVKNEDGGEYLLERVILITSESNFSHAIFVSLCQAMYDSILLLVIETFPFYFAPIFWCNRRGICTRTTCIWTWWMKPWTQKTTQQKKLKES